MQPSLCCDHHLVSDALNALPARQQCGGGGGWQRVGHTGAQGVYLLRALQLQIPTQQHFIGVGACKGR